MKNSNLPAPKKIWQPSVRDIERSNLYRFMSYVNMPYGRYGYNDLFRWSVEDCDQFWKAFFTFSGIISQGELIPVREGKKVPGVRFFPRVRLNYAQNLLRFNEDRTALVCISEHKPKLSLTFRELYRQVAKAQAALLDMNVKQGDIIAGYLNNTYEAVIAMCAAASIGAVWTSCSSDFGCHGVVDRFGQVKPRILFASSGYRYGGKLFSCMDKVREVVTYIKEIEKVIIIHSQDDVSLKQLKGFGGKAVLWDDFIDNPSEKVSFYSSKFNHPLFILFSSGTTGPPKCIVHGTGGTLLQHAKELLLHTDLHREDAIFYFTTCGWMMWNWLISALFTGSTVVLYDGSPSFPTIECLWKLVEDEGITHFGTSPKFIEGCKNKVEPKRIFSFKKLRIILSTGAPLLPEDFDWIYSNVGQDIRVSSICGGTDIVSCFMGGNPLVPVYRGEIQSIGLGMDVAVYDKNNRPVKKEKGELVCRKPFPSMPLYFLNDRGGWKYKKAYFKNVKDIWFHGDYVMHTESQGISGGIVVFGRSDTTLNPGGIRIGTSEIYRCIELLPYIEDSIVIGQPFNKDIRIVLFVKMREGRQWSSAVDSDIKSEIRRRLSPRHVPAKIIPVKKIPYTISGKKVEKAVLQIIQGIEPKNKEALIDASALEPYRGLAGTLHE